MPRLTRQTLLSLALACGLSGIAESTARADEADVCIAAAEASQTLLKNGKLLDARKELATCRGRRCPDVVRADCEKWATSLEDSMPSVVFGVTSGAGGDVANPSIEVDGKPNDVQSGRAVELDPGNHDVRVRAVGFTPASVVVTAREGQKTRIVSVVLVPVEAAAAPPPPTASWVFWGTAGVALVTTAVFGLLAKSEHDDVQSRCGEPIAHCTNDEVSTGRTYATVADIALGVTIVAAAAGLVFWLASPSPAKPSALAQRNAKTRAPRLVVRF